MTDLIQSLQNQSVWDWIVLLTGIFYVYYAARNNPICWIWGIISCGVLSVVTVTKYGLYADGALNAFYVVMAFIGLHNWKSKGDKKVLAIKHINLKEIAIYLIVGILTALFCEHFLSIYTQALATTLDSFTTIFSIIATIWLVQRYVENWLLWIIVDLAYVYLYYRQGATLFSLLFVIYSVIAIQGFFIWRKELER